MKRTCLLALGLLLVLSVSAVANELYNGSFSEPGDPVAAWQRNGGNYKTDGWLAGTALFYAQDGDGFFYGVTTQGGTKVGDVYQDVYLAAPGAYNVNLTCWADIADGGGVASWGELQLLADGAVVASQRLTFLGDGGSNPQSTGWQKLSVNWNGNTYGQLSAKFAFSLDGPAGGWSWGQAYCDNFVMDATPVPEPASILALVGGLAGLIIRRRR